jgi:prevent-host-death family protein
MLQINDDTVMVGATEFRSEMPKLIKTLHLKKVIIMNRGEPVAVIQNYQDFKRDEDWMEEFEDLVLGSIAKERDENSKDSDFYSHEEVLKELGLNK